jgi:hypothetical protein
MWSATTILFLTYFDEKKIINIYPRVWETSMQKLLDQHNNKVVTIDS